MYVEKYHVKISSEFYCYSWNRMVSNNLWKVFDMLIFWHIFILTHFIFWHFHFLRHDFSGTFIFWHFHIPTLSCSDSLLFWHCLDLFRKYHILTLSYWTLWTPPQRFIIIFAHAKPRSMQNGAYGIKTKLVNHNKKDLGKHTFSLPLESYWANIISY